MEHHEDQTDKVLSQWRQGDAISDHQLVSDILSSLNIYAEKPSSIIGWVVTSQTCDVVRESRTQPFVQVCAIVKDVNRVAEARKRKSPRFAYIPALAEASCVADLAVTTTLRKDRLVKVKRVDGGFDHEEGGEDQLKWISRFQHALSRHKARFAFPDNFNSFKKSLGEHLKKASKAKETQHLLDAVDEVCASIEVENDEVKNAHVWFILDADPSRLLVDESLLALNSEVAKIFSAIGQSLQGKITYRIVDQSDLSLLDYRKSHPIDFDDVS